MPPTMAMQHMDDDVYIYEGKNMRALMMGWDGCLGKKKLKGQRNHETKVHVCMACIKSREGSEKEREKGKTAACSWTWFFCFWWHIRRNRKRSLRRGEHGVMLIVLVFFFIFFCIILLIYGLLDIILAEFNSKQRFGSLFPAFKILDQELMAVHCLFFFFFFFALSCVFLFFVFTPTPHPPPPHPPTPPTGRKTPPPQSSAKTRVMRPRG